MDMPISQITLTIARSDTRHARFLATLNDPASGTVAIRIRPDTRRFGWVARDILAALGKREDVSGKGRNNESDTRLAQIWLVAHSIGDLVVVGVEALRSDLISELAMFAFTCGLRLWLVADHELPASASRVFAQWPVVPVGQAKFDAHWQPRVFAAAARPVPSRSLWPTHVPNSDFPVFLTDVHHLLPKPQAQVVDGRFRQAAAAASEALQNPELTDVTAEHVAGLLRAHLNDCVSLAEMVTVVRAFQVAAFHLGWFVQVDTTSFLASSEHKIHATVRNAQTWRSLRAYKQPYRSAVCALRGSDIDLARQQQITIADVEPDGGHVAIAGEHIRIRDDAAVYVRAMLLYRLADGAKPADLLFTRRDGGQVGVRKLVQVLMDAATELGVVLYAGQVKRSNRSNRLWRQGQGISVQLLRKHS